MSSPRLHIWGPARGAGAVSLYAGRVKTILRLRGKLILASLGLVSALSLAACSSDSLDLPPEVDSSRAGTGGSTATYPSFLDKSEYPDYTLFVPAPPKEGSELFRHDVKVYKQTRSFKGTARWSEAAQSAHLDPESISKFFSPVLSRPITKESTPWTYYLIARSSGDAIASGTRGVKRVYMKVRPYVYFKDRTCSTKEDDDKHVNTGSFPSGHASYGQLVALILTEIDPKHQEAILKKGLELGENRVICGFHWQSDVDVGRTIAGYVNARLHADPAFMQALNKAKAEFATEQK